MRSSVARAICVQLSGRGVTDVFGLPGSQTIDLWEALRRSRLRRIVPTSELSASFMAGGYARASGRTGVLITIGDPGFAFAVPGIVEAMLDSVPLLVLATPSRRVAAGHAGEFPQSDVARHVAKAVLAPSEPGSVVAALDEASRTARDGEPGPVVVEVASELLQAHTQGTPSLSTEAPSADSTVVRQVADELRTAARPLLLCGGGALDAAASVTRLAELLSVPVITTTSGRGVIAETHALSIPEDRPGSDAAALNDLVGQCDLVLALGCRLSDNGSRGGQLRLPADRLVRVDASPDALGRGYPARAEIVCDVPALVRAVVGELEHNPNVPRWRGSEIADWRTRVESESQLTLAEPNLGGVSARQFFRGLRDVVPADVPVATDSGLHQYLVRSYFPVLAPRTLLVPADFQSMGFGIPTAIGAAISTGRAAVAVVGDGGFAINGSELLTAVKEEIALVVIVVVDRWHGLIRGQQLRRSGHTSSTEIPVPDLELYARSVGAGYLALPDGDPAPIRELLGRGGVTLVEIRASDTAALRRSQARGVVRSAARTLLGR